MDRCYIIDGSRLAILIAKITASMAGIVMQKLAFRLVDVRDEQGLLLRLRISYKDLAEVQAEAMENAAFREFVSSGGGRGRLHAYLSKSIAIGGLFDCGALWRALFLIQICAWKARQEGKNTNPVLFLESRPWIEAITRYSSRHGVETVPVKRAWSGSALMRKLAGPKGMMLARWFRDYFYYNVGGRRKSKVGTKPWSDKSGVTAEFAKNGHPRIAVEYYGHLNMDRPECVSDLFFWQQSELQGSDLLVTFGFPDDPLDDQKWIELRQCGIDGLALHPRATTIHSAPLYTHRPRLNGARPDLDLPRGRQEGPDRKWLTNQIRNYQVSRDYWAELFSREKVKLYVTWYRYDATHCAIADALQSLGGATAIYQRAYDSRPSVETAVAVDIVFGFSQSEAAKESLSKGDIPYHVTTGFLGDYRFPLLRGNARNIRQALKGHGAKRILAFFDENSGDDSRWHTGHEFMRANYAFLIEKVLAEPWLGLVLKPKTPRTLRRRLGPVGELLKRAEATGRCYIFEDGVIQGSYPPAAAALASDIAIHGHLCAATAGLEAALAGVPTLLLDREGWHVSPLYRLGIGRVVFTDWQVLWDALVEHWSRPMGVPGFGDWSPMLDELDPFRDGRAAERMGTYLKWLMDGFKAGLGRETVLADAAEHYCRLWGWDKINKVNNGLLHSCPN